MLRGRSLAVVVGLGFPIAVLAESGADPTGNGRSLEVRAPSLPAVDLTPAAAYSSSAEAPASELGTAVLGLDGPGGSRAGRLSLKTGVGFTASPTDFLLGLEGDVFITHGFAMGPKLQFAIDDPFYFAPSLNFIGMFEVPGAERVSPFVQGGVGFVYANKHHHEQAGFLIDFGGGVDVYVAERVALGTDITFNFIPDDVFGDHFFFAWELLTVRFVF